MHGRGSHRQPHRPGNNSTQKSLELYPIGAVAPCVTVPRKCSRVEPRRAGAFMAKPQTARATAPLGFLLVSFLWQDPETGAVGEVIRDADSNLQKW